MAALKKNPYLIQLRLTFSEAVIMCFKLHDIHSTRERLRD